VATFTYNDVAVSGGKFELRLLDLGGPDVNVVLAGLELSEHVDLGDIEDHDTVSADFDGDGFIAGFDFLLWQIGLGTTAPNAFKSDGDANNDLAVDTSDLDVWELQYGSAAPLVAAATALIATEPVAEPSLTSSDLVDVALAVALAEEADGISGKREFVAHSPQLEFFSVEQIGRTDSVSALSISSSATTGTPRDDERQSPEGPSPWEDAVDELFASVFE
jgi:hypothetical protein